MNSKWSLLVICEMLGHLVNTLTLDDKYSFLNSENLQQSIQMQLSKERVYFSNFFLHSRNLYQFLSILKNK